MKPNPLHAVVFALAIPAAGSFAQETPDIGTLLPEDASALAVIQNLSTLYEMDEEHALRRLVSHGAFEHLYGGMFEWVDEMLSEETLTELGVSADDLARLFPGRLAMAANLDFKALMEASARQAAEAAGGQANMNLTFNTSGFSFLVAADTTVTEEELASLVEGFGQRIVTTNDRVTEFRSFRDEFEGYPQIRLETKMVDQENEAWMNFGFVLADDMLVMMMLPEEDTNLGDHIAADMCRRIRSQGTEPDSLAATRGYIDARDQLADADLFVFAPLSNIAQALEQSISDMYDQASQQAAAGDAPQGMSLNAFVTKDGLLDFLGLKNFKRFTLAAKIRPDGVEVVEEVATNERTGALARMMTFETGIQLPEMDPAGMTGITVSGYKLSDNLLGLLGDINTLSPMLGAMMQMQIGQMEAQGMRLRTSLLPALGPGMIHMHGYANPNPAEKQLPSHVFILNAKDPIGLAQTMGEGAGYLEQMFGLGAELEEPREFMGESVQRLDSLVQMFGAFVELDPSASGAYSIVGDRFIIALGEDNMIDHVIASLKKGGDTLDDHETLSDSWRMWGNEDLVEFTYEDLATLMKMAAYGSEDAIQFRAQVGQTTGAEEKAADVIGEMPPLDDLHFSITTKSYDTPDAWVARIYIAEKPAGVR